MVLLPLLSIDRRNTSCLKLVCFATVSRAYTAKVMNAMNVIDLESMCYRL